MSVTFPHMGNTWIPVKALFDYLDIEFIVPPHNSKNTLSIGTKYSPEGSCLPFKLNIGNFIEAAKLGADTILITGGVGPCRFGYYGQLEQEILQDLGLDFELIMLEPSDGSWTTLLKRIKQAAGNKSWHKIMRAVQFAFRKAKAMDEIEDMIHWARPRSEEPAEVEALYRTATQGLDEAQTSSNIKRVVQATRDSIELLNLKAEFEPLKVGIIGEIYTLLDTFSNHDLERHLGKLGVQVDRSIYLSGWINEHLFMGLRSAYKETIHHKKLAKPFLNHTVGGHGQETIGAAVEFQRLGFDGTIQLLPLTCMPEIVAAAILPQVSKTLEFPIMTLYVDEQSGEAGLLTRLEAFVDLIDREKSLRRRDYRAKLVSGS